jgi:hypothetical protein
MLVILIEPCRTRSSHFCRAYNFHRHICYSKTHSVPSTTCRSSIHHHRLHRHMYHIGTAVLSLASMQSSHNSCYPSLTPTSVSKMIQGGSIIPRRVFSDTIRHPTVSGRKWDSVVESVLDTLRHAPSQTHQHALWRLPLYSGRTLPAQDPQEGDCRSGCCRP